MIQIKAYTDTTGSSKSNIALGSKRLDATLKILRSEGFTCKIDTFNFGGQKLKKYSCDSLSRRVDILVYDVKFNFEFDKPIPLQLNFTPGTTTLTSGIDQVEMIRKILLSNKDITVELNGHVCCDNDIDLSLKRAEAIKKILVRKGVSQEKITCNGFGNMKPIKKEITEADRATNRRVEVVFHALKE